MAEADLTWEETHLAELTVDSWFTSAKGWFFDGPLGKGQYGNVFKVRKGDQALAVKITFGAMALLERYPTEMRATFEETKALITEANYLRRLRGCPHIVQSIDVADDPFLQDPPPGMAHHGMNIWVFMELLPQGTFGKFYAKFRASQRELLPNRVCWRFFLCMLRMCVEMAFCDDPEVDTSTTPLQDLLNRKCSNIGHYDLHRHNCMLGNAMPGLRPPEHTITPILKAIDFGLVQEDDGEEFGSGPQMNLERVAETFLHELVFGVRHLFTGRHPGADLADATFDGETYECVGGDIWNERMVLIELGLDADFLEVLVRCLASEPSRRPDLIPLVMQVEQAVLQRDQAFYGDVETESDEYIMALMNELLDNPFPAPPQGTKRGRSDDDDDDDAEEPPATKPRLDDAVGDPSDDPPDPMMIDAPGDLS